MSQDEITPEEVAEALDRHMAEIVSELCETAAATGNPLLYLQALGLALGFGHDRSVRSGKQWGGDEHSEIAADIYVRIPRPLYAYLSRVLHAVGELARSRDFRDGQYIEPEEAATLFSQAFGVTRQGFNAFRKSERQEKAGDALREEYDERIAGATAAAAREKIMARYGFSDERSYRRFLKGTKRGKSGGKPVT